jgi:putative endonuclease
VPTKPLKLKPQPRSPKLQTHNSLLGHWGEQFAADFLVAKGYRLLHRNLKVGKSELDIVALDKAVDEVVIVEVKTRGSLKGGHPSLSIRGQKWLALQRAAAHLLKLWQYRRPIRFDIVSVSRQGIEHFQNVTWP